MRIKRPKDLYYSESHLWVKLEEKNEASIGVTDYLVRNMETTISIKLPKVKSEIEQDAFLGEIETDDGLATFISPVSGKITAVNNELLKNHYLLLEDNYDEGWLVKVKLSDPTEVESLISYDEYNEFIESELEELDEVEDEEEAIE
ncbi:MAG: glycine cleavage system protein H [Planctomycetota bacterium]|nr:glycine cleavage system protein H [Planctomycetota bacterium]MDI6786943.1 glycine cleavage system protein H [Planctomycetota bacterium]